MPRSRKNVSPSSSGSKHSKKRSASSPSSSSSSSSNKKRRSTTPTSISADLYDGETGRIDTNIVSNSAASVVELQGERFKNLDENLSREELQTRYEELRDLRVTAPEKLLKEAIVAHAKETEAAQGLVETYKRRAKELQAQINIVNQEKESAIEEELNAQVAEAKATIEAKMNSTIASLKAEFEKEKSELIARSKSESNSSIGNGNEQVDLGYFKGVAQAYESIIGLR
jgi:hypothetical protein